MPALKKLRCPVASWAASPEVSTTTIWGLKVLLLLLAVILPLSLHAQSNFVYVNNQSAANSISAFSVASNGALSPLTGSPFLTGGHGANVNCYGIDRIVISAPNNVLFVTNTLDLTISALQINPATGALTPVAGSPFASGLTLDGCAGISLAATPDGQFLMASSNGQIQTFAIAANGALSLVATTPNCCTPMVSMKISPNGQLLAVSNENSVSVFTITPVTGVLTPVLGSPFPKTGAATVGGLDFNSCSNSVLYGGESSPSTNLADAWTVAPTGVLSAIPGSPFHAASGTDSNIVLVTPDNTRLFESNQFNNAVNAFTPSANGSLTSIGKFGGVGFLHVPVGMATDQSGAFLYVADDSFGIAVLRVNADGSLANLSNTALTSPGEIQGLAAYPPRSCTTADLAVSVTASPNPVFGNSNLTYTITVTNNGPDAPAFTISDTLPTTLTFVSCAATGGGICNGSGLARTISFPALANGASATATLVGKVSGTVVNNSSIIDTVNINNSSAVDPNRANNSASITVTALKQFPTTLTVPTATGTFGGNAILTAVLKKTSDNSLIAGETISFFLNRAAVGSAITDATGTATLSVPLGTTTIGTYVGAVIANFAGDTSFATSSGTGNLTVTKAVLKVTANDATRLYGDANPAFSYTLSGFVLGDTASVVTGTASCTTTATAASPAGTYPITCTQGTLAATNYLFSFVAGTLTVNPAPLTVSVNNASRSYGAVNPAFTGTITGLKNSDPITATYTTTATTASPVGTYPITAVLADPSNLLGNYVVTSNPGTLTVTPAALTVIPNNLSRLYGDPNPTLTGVIVGIQNGDNITATYSTTATPASPVGNYPIVPTLVDPTNRLGNYVVTLNNGTLAVSPAPLTVTAADATRPFGFPNPAFTGTIAGIKNNDNITATYSTTATATSPLGTYPITATLVDPTNKLGNYSVTNTPGTLAITSAQLTVTVADATRVYGDPNPAFTVSFSGFVNGDTAAVVSGTPSCSSAAPTSAVGTYPIVCTQGTLSATSYVFVFVSGTLTVTPAPLSVTAANSTRLYGDANPAFSGTITGIKNGDNITANYTTTATVTSLIGTYPITPVLVDPTSKLGNYTVTSNNATLTVTQAPIVVTAANLSRAYGAPNPALTGTITGVRNGDPITVTFATTAIQTSPAGTYPITPSLNDPTGKLSNYTLTVNNGTLTVTAVPLVVTVVDATRPFGAPNPAFTGIITGLQNGDNITAIYSTVATAASPVGTYPITPTLADPTGKLSNYTVTSTNGTLTITNAVLTVTAANASRFYGDPNPAFTGTITGLKNGDTITATFSSVAVATSAPGTYAIVPALLDPNNQAGNYTVVLNNGVLTVNAAPLSVVAASATRGYGAANPAFTGTITGLKNGDNITASFTTVADPTSNVGSYAITPVLTDPTNKLSNYAVSLTNGTLTITQVPLTVTANNASRVYGDPNLAFTGTITGLVNGDNITFSATSAGPTAAVGTYPIVPTLVDPTNKLGNYTVASTNGTLTVTQAPLSVVAANSTRAFGDPNNLSGTLTGVKNGDNITAVYSTTATATSAPGTYPITASLSDPTNKLSNYNVTITNATLTVTPATLTVTAANASMIYGDAVPALGRTIAGIKNGDNITASFSTTATSISAPGTYPIVAAVSDNGTGALANYTVVINNGTLAISPAPLVVTAANASRPYGDPNLAFTGTITGLKNGDNIGATFSAAADPTSPVGNYAIIPTLSDPAGRLSNYALTINNGVLTVAPAPLSVIGANASRLYGDPNQAFTGTLTGVKNGDNITAGFSSAANAASSVGTYPIVATLSDPAGKLSNYSVVSSNGTLTVNPAPLTAAATSTSRVYGHANPSFNGTISGLKNNDPISATFSSAADLTSAVGTYPILPAFNDPAGKLGNYTVNATGALTVTPQPLSVTLANATRVYGDPNPVFTGSIGGIRNNDNITLAPTTTADATSPVGTYAIVAGFNDPTGKIGNYAVTSNTATLTITPAPLTIQAANASAPVGGPFPTFTGTITGLKNTDVITASYSTTADATSPAGTYPISPSADASPALTNYAVTLINGTLTLQ